MTLARTANHRGWLERGTLWSRRRLLGAALAAAASIRAISTDILDFRARVLAIEGSKLRLTKEKADNHCVVSGLQADTLCAQGM